VRECGDGGEVQRTGKEEAPGIQDHPAFIGDADPNIASQHREPAGEFYPHGLQHPTVYQRMSHITASRAVTSV
jgi:hypothetical protein